MLKYTIVNLVDNDNITGMIVVFQQHKVLTFIKLYAKLS